MTTVRAMPVLAATFILFGCGRPNDTAVDANTDSPSVFINCEMEVPGEAVTTARDLIERYYDVQVGIGEAGSMRELEDSPGRYTLWFSADDSPGAATNRITIEGRLAILRTGDLGQNTDLIAKEAMRAFGLMIGLKDCPNPRCCMFVDSSLKELAAKGMNPCPPCHMKSIDLVRRAGLSAPPGKRIHPGAKR